MYVERHRGFDSPSLRQNFNDLTMKDLLLQILIIAYGATGVVSVIGYWPTIKDLYQHKKPSANISSYVLWTATSGVAFLYSVCILQDVLVQIVSGVSLAACAVVLVLSLWLRTHHA